MIKLSELKNDEMIIIDSSDDGTIMTKEDYLNEIEEHKGLKIYTATQYKANIDALDMIESAIECEYQNMFEDWDIEVRENVSIDDIKDMQCILDRILSRGRTICYFEKDEIEIDI